MKVGSSGTADTDNYLHRLHSHGCGRAGSGELETETCTSDRTQVMERGASSMVYYDAVHTPDQVLGRLECNNAEGKSLARCRCPQAWPSSERS